jgi:hypothetical protein
MNTHSRFLFALAAVIGTAAALVWSWRTQVDMAPCTQGTSIGSTAIDNADAPTPQPASAPLVPVAARTAQAAPSTAAPSISTAINEPGPPPPARVMTRQEAYEDWQRRVGYRIDEKYENMTVAELERLSAAGDPWASQTLGEQAWHQMTDRDQATQWLERAAGQGSVAAATYASVLYDPDLPDLEVLSQRLGRPLPADRDKAYVWARIAAMRGDRDAIFGIARHTPHYTAEEIGRLEMMALELYGRLQNEYAHQHGRAFVNVSSVEFDPNVTEGLLQALSRDDAKVPEP